jgi:hypothetical protein
MTLKKKKADSRKQHNPSISLKKKNSLDGQIPQSLQKFQNPLII